MMSRIQSTFERLRADKQGGFIAYVTAGDPNRDKSLEVLLALGRNGADVIEVGVPFSDPLADGPVIQRASERALAAGMTLRGALDLVRDARKSIDTPIVLFTYANPVARMEAATFVREAADAGVDGVLILDYPIEEAGPLGRQIASAGMDPIFLISPTTTDDRIRASAQAGRGFLYVISRLGVTGVRDALAADVAPLIARVRKNSDLPVALGFGISTPEQVAQACQHADAAVVGSALVDVIARHGANGSIGQRVGEYVTWLKSAL
jgi:tryptophan synthase alpha chain